MKNLLLSALFLFSLSAFAQDMKSLEAFPFEWAKSYDMAHEKSDMSMIMKYYDRSLTFEINIVQIDGQVTETQGDYFAFENRTAQFVNMKDLSIEIIAGEVHLTKLNGEIGFVNFSIDFEAMMDGKVVAEGTTIYSMALVWKSNKWMITHSSSFGFRDKQYIGVCPCSVMQDANGAFNTLTVVPSGVTLTKKQNSFAVSKSSDATIFTSGGKSYMWYSSGRLVEMNSESAPKDLGTVNGTNVDAIKQILKGSIYKGTCLELVDLKSQ